MGNTTATSSSSPSRKEKLAALAAVSSTTDEHAASTPHGDAEGRAEARAEGAPLPEEPNPEEEAKIEEVDRAAQVVKTEEAAQLERTAQAAKRTLEKKVADDAAAALKSIENFNAQKLKDANTAKEVASREALEMAALEEATRPSTEPTPSVSHGVREVMDNPLIVEAMERRRQTERSEAVLKGLPLRDAVLRCDNFEGGLALIGKVEIVDPDIGEDGQVLVWLDALKHHWPIQGSMIHGKNWIHDPKRYPRPGEDEEFDAKFRKSLKLHSNEPLPVFEKFKAPRRARPGYAWAKALQPVAALGFTLAGEANRNWGPGTDHLIGEITLGAFDPGLFQKL